MTRKYLLILSIIGNVFCQQQSHFDTRTASLIHTSQQRTESSNNNNNNFNINNNPSAVPENSNLSVNNLNSNNPNPNNNFQESQFNNNNNNNPDQSGFNQQFQSDSSQPQQQNFGSQITLNTNEQEILPGGCSQGYECVPNFNCMNNTVIHDGVGILDSRFGDICTYPNMCCHLRQRRPSTLPPPFPTTQTPLVPHKCGRRNFDGVGTTIAENERDTQTYFGEFPWMVAVLRQEVLNTGQVINVYQCGGSIIDPLVILTAAHCVSGEHAGHFHIRAGEWDTQTTNESLPHQDRNVEQIVLHPDFQKASLANDIAILFLESPIQLADHIQTICLPPSTETFDYRNCYATGWGKDMFGQAGRHQVILKKIGLPVVPRDDCETTLRTTRLGKYFELHESFLCAGGELRKDTCKGDGGSPLTCPILGNTRQYYQAGIVAWGIGCGENNLPGVYTSVPNFREWIDRTIKSKGLDASNYAIN